MSEGASNPDRRIVLLTVGAPHGVRGAVRVTVHAEDPFALKRYNPLQTIDGRALRLKTMRQIGKGFVAEFDGLQDRDAAAALRGSDLGVPRRRLPKPEPDEYYYVDLEGLEARREDGTRFGTVQAVDDYGAGPLLSIEGEGAFHLVPFTQAAVPVVAIADGYLTVADGFVEEESGSDGEPDAGHRSAP